MLPPSLVDRLERVLGRIESLLPEPEPQIDWAETAAARWQANARGGHLAAVAVHSPPAIDDLLGVDRPKAALLANTRQFAAGLPANHALLWGPRGTGKSTLVRAVVAAVGAGLRIVEVPRDALFALPAILDRLAREERRFVLYCDDLAFELGDPGYKALKSTLDGSVSGLPGNTILYATSNRRHLLPEPASDNQGVQVTATEIHFAEGVEERLSLSERFGLWLAFHPFDQSAYLEIVRHWLAREGEPADDGVWRVEALRFALEHGSRSGRTARQFAWHWAGRRSLARATGKSS
ncbi:MAG TPA: AAA family ATPase [Gammaproteobacteria bacterium]|nr:AAA family ATPase [Gammaproteobacteria bacterium]